jgi:hypothetical protein
MRVRIERKDSRLEFMKGDTTFIRKRTKPAIGKLSPNPSKVTMMKKTLGGLKAR